MLSSSNSSKFSEILSGFGYLTALAACFSASRAALAAYFSPSGAALASFSSSSSGSDTGYSIFLAADSSASLSSLIWLLMLDLLMNYGARDWLNKDEQDEMTYVALVF
jgi:hypothetical protein